jgi:hypothetical protein
MQVVVQHLVAKRREAEHEMAERLNAESAVLRERLLKEKAERKAAALERSRIRQEAERAIRADAEKVNTVIPVPISAADIQGVEGDGVSTTAMSTITTSEDGSKCA